MLSVRDDRGSARLGFIFGFGLGNTIGFTSDTSLFMARMILDGVLDELDAYRAPLRTVIEP